MAEQEAIGKYDLVSKEALDTWQYLIKLIDSAQKSLKEVIKLGPKIDKSLGMATKISSINKQITQLTSNLNKFASAQQKLSAAHVKLVNNSTKLITAQGKLAASAKKTAKAQADVSGASTKQTHFFRNLVKSTLGLVSAYIGLHSVISLVKKVFRDTRSLDQMRFSMQAVIKTSEELAQTEQFLIQTSKNYGLDLLTLTARYNKFRAATLSSNMSVSDTQKVFDSFSKAAGVLGLKTDEVAGVFLALEQMISKGKVTTEELRRQLGERLPGAFSIMANSLGVTTSELDKMLKKGQIISADVLPKFAAELEKTYGIETVSRVDTLTAAQGRLTTAWLEFVKALEGGEAFKSVINTLTKLLSDVGYVTTWIGGNQQKFATAVLNKYTSVSVEVLRIKNMLDQLPFEDLATYFEEQGEKLREDLMTAGVLAKDVNIFMAEYARQRKVQVDLDERNAKQEAYLRSRTISQLEEEQRIKLQLVAAYNTSIKKAVLSGDKELEDFIDTTQKEVKRVNGLISEIEAEIRRRKKVVTPDNGAWAKSNALYKAKLNRDYANYKAHLDQMRELAINAMMGQGMTDPIIEEENKRLQMADEAALTSFKIDQLNKYKVFAIGHEKDIADADEQIAKEQSDLAIKSSNFKIWVWREQFKQYKKMLEDIKDADIAAAEEKLAGKIAGRSEDAMGKMKKVKYQWEFEEIGKEYDKGVLQDTISSLEEMVSIENLTTNEIADINKRLADTKKALRDKEMADIEENFKRKKELEQAAFDLGVQAVEKTFEIFASFQDAKMQQLDADFEHETALAGENLDQKIAAENKYNKAKRKLQRQMAILDKTQASFAVVIDTAKGVMNAASKVATIPLIPYITALGALSLAAVLARPIPNYEEGGRHSGGPARFSEGGKQELFIPDIGMPMLTPAVETIANMPAGKFVPNTELQKTLASYAMNNFTNDSVDVDFTKTNSILSKIAESSETKYQSGYKIVSKSNIVGRYVTRS
jgi:tape measure domain-containing protein